MSARTTINMLILIVSATALGILIWVIANFKKVMDRMLQIGIVLVKENETKIQPLIDDFSTSTANNLLGNGLLITKSTNVVSSVLKSGNLNDGLSTQTNAVLADPSVRTMIADVAAGAIENKDVKTALSNTIKTEPVVGAISSSILHAIGGEDGNMLAPNVAATKFDQALVGIINQSTVSNAIGNAVSNYPQSANGQGFLPESAHINPINNPASYQPKQQELRLRSRDANTTIRI